MRRKLITLPPAEPDISEAYFSVPMLVGRRSRVFDALQRSCLNHRLTWRPRDLVPPYEAGGPSNVGWDKRGGESQLINKLNPRIAASENRKTSWSRPAPAHLRRSIRES
jgi:hypothetical protein